MGGGHNSPVSTVPYSRKQLCSGESTTTTTNTDSSAQHHTISLKDTSRCGSPSTVSTSSSSYSTYSDTVPVLQPSTLDLAKRNTSPITYVPNSKALVNLDMGGSPCTSPARHNNEYSSVKTYMECLSPQSLKCVLVGDSGVGKTALLTNYTTEKFVKQHSPTIYDKFISKFFAQFFS